MGNISSEKNKVIVLGMGQSGISACKLLLKTKVKVLLYNSNEDININEIKDNFDDLKNIDFKVGVLTEKDLTDVGLCIISPGIDPKKEFVQLINEFDIPIWSELELGYHFCLGEISAITGSNGKTTTTKLVGDIFKKNYLDVHVCGNIGNPLCNDALRTTEDSYTVLEVSSFQLDDIVDFKPHIACITNITPDHLNRYGSFENYINSKLRISLNQTEEDYLILNYDDPILKDLSSKNIFKAKIVYFSSKEELKEGFYYQNNYIYFKKENEIKKLLDVNDLLLVGTHNYENVMAAMAICYYSGIDLDKIVEDCKDFKPVEHRIEFVRERSGVKFFNDSKATNPDSAIKGLLAMKGKTVLIAGGSDKKSNYLDWVKLFHGRINKLILIGDTKKDIAKVCDLVHFNDYTFATSMEEAVRLAASFANMGENVLLSPACASFGLFKNYEQRGEIFKEEVNKL